MWGESRFVQISGEFNEMFQSWLNYKLCKRMCLNLQGDCWWRICWKCWIGWFKKADNIFWRCQDVEIWLFGFFRLNGFFTCDAENTHINASLEENSGNVPTKCFIFKPFQRYKTLYKRLNKQYLIRFPNVWSSKHTNHSCILRSTHFKKQ